MANFSLSAAQVNDYNNDGYVIIRNFLQPQEVNKLYSIAVEDDTMKKHSFDLNDQSGKKTKLALWYTPGDDAYGLLTKSNRMINAVNKLMEGDSAVFNFNSKLMQK
jgi:phytanoyl-CoA hydroxylase